MDMVVVRTVATRFEAELLAAKLGAHGLLWQIRSRELVPTTHPIGFLEVLVPADEVDLAEEVLTPQADVEGDDDDADGEGGSGGRPLRRGLTPAMATLRVLLGAGLLVAVALFVGGWLVDLLRFLDVVD